VPVPVPVPENGMHPDRIAAIVREQEAPRSEPERFPFRRSAPSEIGHGHGHGHGHGREEGTAPIHINA